MLRLTEYSELGGCGCKISLNDLNEIISFNNNIINPEGINEYQIMEDCAVSNQDDNLYNLHTLDFFTPIVNQPYLFGQISALNSLSDIYAMGGNPKSALVILGWPKEIPINFAKEVLNGASDICNKEGVVIAGGHSIYNSQPLFGLSVFGYVEKKNIKRVKTDFKNCDIYITKKIGTGILSSLIKKDKLTNKEISEFSENVLMSNNIGIKLGELPYVKSMTDISGFGLGGHLFNICKNSEVDAFIEFSQIPIIECAKRKFLESKNGTSVTKKNYEKVRSNYSELTDFQINVIFDPQTNGGLLFLVDKNFKEQMKKFLLLNKIEYSIIGKTQENKKKQTRIYIL